MDQLEDKDPFGLSRLEDPEFEVRERARLTASDEGDVPPPKTQKAFVDHVNRYRSNKNLEREFDVRPDKLFYARTQRRKDEEVYERCHYKRPTKSEFSGNDIQAELRINKQPNGKYHTIISKYGEGPSFTGEETESLKLHFIPPVFASEGDVDFKQISINAQFGGRNLGIHYGSEGNISTFIHGSTKHLADLCASNEGRQDINIAQLLQNGEASFQRGQNNYHIKYDKENALIRMERRVNGEVVDSVGIPQHLDGQQKFDELFPPTLLDNLGNADPQEDQTWKNLSLNTLGITWSMPNPR